MAIKVLIYRKIKPGKEKELSEAVRALRLKAMVAQGYISGRDLALDGRPVYPASD